MDTILLQTATVEAEIDASGQLTRLRAAAPELGWSAPQDIRLAWSLRTHAAGSDTSKQDAAGWSSSPSEAPGGTAARFHGEFRGAALGLMVGVDAHGLYWTVEITNLAEQVIEEFAFHLHGAGLKETGLACTIPYCAGWSLPLASLKDGDGLRMAYPVKAAMQWIDLYTPEWGIYFGVHDPLPLYKQLEIRRDNDQEMISWIFSDLALERGASITLPKVHLAVHPGDWHAGADMYRAWASAFVCAPEVPDWYRAQPLWAWVGLRGQYDAKPWRKTDGLQNVSDQAYACGIELSQLTAYTELGHDTLYPDYLPGVSLGGDEGLREAVAAIHAAGRRMSIYTNGRIVDPASSLTQAQREEWAVRPEPGSGPAQETYGRVTFDILCPGAEGWQQLFIQRLMHLVTAFDVDGIYIDQVSAATSLPCYAGGHAHSAPNRAWACYQPFLKQLRAALKAVKPTLMLATEGVNDLLGQYFDSQQAHQDWPSPLRGKAVPLDSLFRYTFPEFLLNSGCVTQGDSGLHYLKVAHLAGSGFDFGVEDWSTVSEVLCRWSRFAIGWRANMADWVAAAPIPLPDCTPGIQATRFIQTGVPGTVIHLAWLPGDPNQPAPETIHVRVPLEAGSKVNGIRAETCDGTAAIEWKVRDQQIELELRFAHLAGLHIQTQAEEH